MPFRPGPTVLGMARRRNVTDEGVALTVGLGILSLLAATAIAIACSYRPILVWWVMVTCSAINLVRFLARKKAASSELPQSAAGWSPHAALAHEGRCFRAWFAQHNLMWTMTGFGVSLLLWHWFGPTLEALIVMSALIACGLLAAVGVVIGAGSRRLGLCWRVPGPTPAFTSIAGFLSDAGAIMILRNRSAHANAHDWASGGRFHELFLVVDQLRDTHAESRLFATFRNNEPGAKAALMRKERLDRAVALAPLFVAGLVFAALVVPPLAGDAPLPPLWHILSRTTKSLTAVARGSYESTNQADPANSPTAEDAPRAIDPATRVARRPDPRDAAHSRNGESGSSSSSAEEGTNASDPERPDAGADASSAGDRNGQSGADRSAANSDREAANGRESAGKSRTERISDSSGERPWSGVGNGAESMSPAARVGTGSDTGDADSSSAGDQSSGGSRRGQGGGQGRGGKAFGTGPSSPQRAANPVNLPPLPQNPGDMIELSLPPLASASQGGEEDESQGEKRKGSTAGNTQRYQPQPGSARSPKEPSSHEPAQRWPNWVFLLLRR
jgi:hypothetical protein